MYMDSSGKIEIPVYMDILIETCACWYRSEVSH